MALPHQLRCVWRHCNCVCPSIAFGRRRRLMVSLCVVAFQSLTTWGQDWVVVGDGRKSCRYGCHKINYLPKGSLVRDLGSKNKYITTAATWQVGKGTTVFHRAWHNYLRIGQHGPCLIRQGFTVWDFKHKIRIMAFGKTRVWGPFLIQVRWRERVWRFGTGVLVEQQHRHYTYICHTLNFSWFMAWARSCVFQDYALIYLAGITPASILAPAVSASLQSLVVIQNKFLSLVNNRPKSVDPSPTCPSFWEIKSKSFDISLRLALFCGIVDLQAGDIRGSDAGSIIMQALFLFFSLGWYNQVPLRVGLESHWSRSLRGHSRLVQIVLTGRL